MKKGQVAFLTGTHVVNDLYQGAVPALLPFMMLERGYSYSAVAGITLAATGLSSVVQPAFGMLVDRKSRNWLVPTGFVTAAAGIVVAAMSTTYIVTWLAIAVAGIGIAAYHPPATNLARAAGGHSQKAMSVFSVGGTLGASLAHRLSRSWLAHSVCPAAIYSQFLQRWRLFGGLSPSRDRSTRVRPSQPSR